MEEELKDLGMRIHTSFFLHEDPSFTLEKGDLLVSYLDHDEESVTILFVDAPVFKWVDYSPEKKEEPSHGHFEVLNSKWLEHYKGVSEKKMTPGDFKLEWAKNKKHHYKLRFEKIGCLDVICDSIKLNPEELDEVLLEEADFKKSGTD
ncbi:hypothetical protein KY361_05165 [Candidatus Woesearchaeota archaeon]|nr:hypothetical protein [Candidatus Woesearchaeota archaeon]